jgi:hypothetical protein
MNDFRVPAYWNYRVVRTTTEHYDGEKEASFAIHEVHYSKEGKPILFTADPMYPRGETLEEFKDDLEKFLSALDKPTLNEENIVYE